MAQLRYIALVHTLVTNPMWVCFWGAGSEHLPAFGVICASVERICDKHRWISNGLLLQEAIGGKQADSKPGQISHTIGTYRNKWVTADGTILLIYRSKGNDYIQVREMLGAICFPSSGQPPNPSASGGCEPFQAMQLHRGDIVGPLSKARTPQ